MNPQDFMAVADHLLTRADAASCRSATSRAYYCLFHRTQEILAANGLSVSGLHSAHDTLVKLLMQSGNPVLVGLGGEMSDLRNARNHADYKITDSKYERQNTVASNVLAAKDVALRLEAFFKTTDAPAAIITIRDYGRNTLRLKGF